MNEQQVGVLCDMLGRLSVPIGIWDVSDMEMFELNDSTPLEAIEAFLNQHPNAIGEFDALQADGEWSIKGWMMPEAPTKRVSDIVDYDHFHQATGILDTHGAKKLLFNLCI
jgi:hypothetical protein